MHINGGKMTVDVVDHTNGGAFEFNAGTLSVNHFDGDLVNVAGALAPGDSAGSTLIVGDYTQESGGSLAIEIGGVAPGGDHDLISVTGDAQIDGILELSLLDGFSPDASNEFTVFAAESLFGFFDNVSTGQRLDTIDGRGSFVVNYGIGSALDETRIVLTDFISKGLPGDFDADGDVDGNDFLFWQRGDSPHAGSADDLADWEVNFGATSSSLTATAIPEPTSIMLFAPVIVALLSCRRCS